MDEVKVSPKCKVILLSLLVILNFVIRIPSITHEKGSDSFFIHALANSITSFGMANWWSNWLSIFGLYPYSYASAVPHILSGFSQLTNIEMENTILILSIILGIISIFTSYLLGGIIYNNFVFKYIFSFVFSLSQGILIFTTWETSSRGLFLVLFPLYMFLLLRLLNIKSKKTIVLILILLILLFSTHMLAYFALFFFVFALFLLILYDKITLSHNIQVIGYISLISILFLAPFMDKGLITVGSRYQWLMSVAIVETRYVGPFILLLLGGVIYSILKYSKQISETFILLCSIFLLPIIYSQTYGHFAYLLFSIFFISVSLENIISIRSKHISKYMIFLLLIFVIFSSFYNHWRTNDNVGDWYVSDDFFEAGVWANNYIDYNKVGISTEEVGRRFGAISNQHPIILSDDPLALIYGYRNMSKIPIYPISPFTLSYYFNGPYVAQIGNSINGQINWILERDDIDYITAKNILNEYDVSYFIMDVKTSNKVYSSIILKKICLYDNNRIKIWILD